MITYCKLCLLPSTKPDLYFDSEGMCAACLSYRHRSEIDWEKRKGEFIELVLKVNIISKME